MCVSVRTLNKSGYSILLFFIGMVIYTSIVPVIERAQIPVIDNTLACRRVTKKNSIGRFASIVISGRQRIVSPTTSLVRQLYRVISSQVTTPPSSTYVRAEGL